MRIALVTLGLAGMFGMLTGVHAQDWIKAAPQGKSVLVDEPHLRMVEVVIPPGGTEPAHTHPEYIEFILEPARMLVTYTGKAPETWTPEKGKAYYGQPDPPHSMKNVDSRPLRLLLVELKDKPFTSSR